MAAESAPPSGHPTQPGCPDVNQVLAFIEGVLSEAEARQLELHLDVCAACRALISALGKKTQSLLPPPASAPTETPGPTAEEAAPLLPEHRIGRYVIERLLGAGGMGQVYLARDPELDRRVAIKVLRKDSTGAWLQREAQAMAKLRHPNVVGVYDFGEQRGRLYLAMEFVPGQTLSSWLARPRARHQVLELFRQAGEGLAAAHAAGLVHRDFKPENVLVGEDGTARVTDFGLARAQAGRPIPTPAEGLLAVDLTQKGSLLGTPRYMSPEQFQGLPTDARSDQFSFCVALYHALFGEAPFAGDTVLALRAAVLAGKLRAPPAGSRVPPALRSALLRGLSREPDARFPSMELLLRAIARADGSLSHRASRAVRRAVGLGAAATAIVALLTGTPLLRGFDERAQGLLLAAARRPWNPGVQLVTIDQPTLDRLGWPMHRALLARVIEAIGAAGAKVIAIDGFLNLPAPDGPVADAALGQAIAHGPPVVTAVACTDGAAPGALARFDGTLAAGPTPAHACLHPLLPVAPVARAASLAEVEIFRAGSGTVRGAYLFARAGEGRLPALALLALARARQLPLEQRPDGVRLGALEVPVDAGGVALASFRLPFQDEVTSFGRIVDALPADGTARLPDALATRFRGRYVLLGQTAETIGDVGVFADGVHRPLLLLHGMLLSDLLEGRPMRAAGPIAQLLLLLGLCALGVLSAALLRPRWLAIAIALLLVGTLGGAVWLARFGVLIAPVSLAFGCVASFTLALGGRLAGEQEERRRLAAALVGQLGESARSQLARSPRPPSPDGARTDATVLVASLAIEDGAGPEEALGAARRALARAAEAIWQGGGRIETSRLEHLVAVFGEPLPAIDHAERALRAGETLAVAGWSVAIASGEVLVGELGREGAAHYGVTGPALGEAVRLLAGMPAGTVRLTAAVRAACPNVTGLKAVADAYELGAPRSP